MSHSSDTIGSAKLYAAGLYLLAWAKKHFSGAIFFFLPQNRFVSDAYGGFVSLSLATFSPTFTNEGERNGELFLALQQTPASKSVSSETTWGGAGSVLMALEGRNLWCLTVSERKQSSCCRVEGQGKVKALRKEAGSSLQYQTSSKGWAVAGAAQRRLLPSHIEAPVSRRSLLKCTEKASSQLHWLLTPSYPLPTATPPFILSLQSFYCMSCKTHRESFAFLLV